jgi:hypothetical protein
MYTMRTVTFNENRSYRGKAANWHDNSAAPFPLHLLHDTVHRISRQLLWIDEEFNERRISTSQLLIVRPAPIRLMSHDNLL